MVWGLGLVLAFLALEMVILPSFWGHDIERAG